MSKGSIRRPTLIKPEEEELRWAFAFGEITEDEFNQKMEALKNEPRFKKGYKGNK